MPQRSLLAILAGVAVFGLGGCAATQSHSGRQQVVVPTPVSEVYSEVDMQMKLATAAAPTEDQTADECLQLEYQRHIRKLMERVVVTAQRLYPDLEEREIRFRFEVAPSAEAGVLSNAGGTIIVLQGTQHLGLPDAVTAYVVAREMGHVIARHHDENSAATVMFSVLAQVLFPAAALVRGLSVVIPTTAAGTALTASAVSYLGATALKSSYHEDHLREAEVVALTLLVESGWNLFDVAGEAETVTIREGQSTWLDELRQSLARLDNAACGPRRSPFRAQPVLAG